MQSNKRKLRENAGGTLPVWIFLFAVCYAFFHIMPALINIEIKHKFWIGDLLDLFTPFVMTLFVYKLYRLMSIERRGSFTNFSSNAINILILIGGVAFMEGHGIHLAANSIFRHLTTLENTPLYSLTYFLDEILSHTLWDAGIVLVSLGLIIIGLGLRYEYRAKRHLILTLLAGMFFGFTFFVDAVEGQTVIFTFPISILIPLGLIFLSKAKKLPFIKNPVLTFFLSGFFVALILFLVWLIWQGGFPEFSKLGWIE